ncbi:MAG: hypothetical protein QNJ22_24370 [Desulfosarcinaceae bacterium]|nr:hypothetical protein [Desulfosarcinaceae bacterium]
MRHRADNRSANPLWVMALILLIVVFSVELRHLCRRDHRLTGRSPWAGHLTPPVTRSPTAHSAG